MTNDYGKGRGRKNRTRRAEAAEAWRKAIAEGRVSRIEYSPSDIHMTAHHTPADAQARVDAGLAQGLKANIVREN